MTLSFFIMCFVKVEVVPVIDTEEDVDAVTLDLENDR